MAKINYRTLADKAIDKYLDIIDIIKERERKGASAVIEDMKAQAADYEKEALENLKKAGRERLKKAQSKGQV